MGEYFGTVLLILGIVAVAAAIISIGYVQSRKSFRESKNYERGLKMIPLLIHLPPSSDDIDAGSRDARDITEEVISQAQVMYNVISSTATSGFKSKFYGQRHLSFELVASGGLIHYYVVVPLVLLDTIKQAVAAAYPTARLEEVEEYNLFSQVGKISGTIGGELTLKKDYVMPIATYQELKRDAMRAILNALATASRDDGIGVQILLRPAPEGWTKSIERSVSNIKKGRKVSSGGLGGGQFARTAHDLLEALWKPPETGPQKEAAEQKQLNGLEQATVEALEEKARYAGYETLVRVIASSSTSARSQMLLKNVVSAFALFDSPTKNGFKFSPTKNIEQFVTSYIFRFFPQEVSSNILNTVELATIFHLPDQSNIPTSQLQRQASKQIDGPTELLNEGVLLGYNMFRGVKKPIRLGTVDRRRHTYIIGQTGTGKSGLLENLALQDMLDGRGFAFVDPHGDSAEKLLAMVPKERVEDIIYFDPGDMTSPIGLNMFEFDHPDQKDFLIQEAINMLYSLYDPGHTGIVGPRMEHIFRNCALLLMSDPAGGTFIDIPKLLVDDDFMKAKLPHVTDQNVLDFWTKEYPNSKRSNESGEVTSWVVSKFGPFMSNEMMRNIIGQTKSGFNLREIMDNKKILLVNLSKGKMGELNSKLLGMIFVMKFQAAAMGRVDTPEDQREDFCLYVDEFQNFATDSFESILSEARKFRLNLIVGNQFMTQLTDKIREAIIGNVGTVVCARIGTTDAELMVKKFTPTFDIEDLQKLPNFESVVSVMINGVPSAPFSMSFIPPMGHPNRQLADALRKLSAAKYGHDRYEVEQTIFKRLRAGEEAKEQEKQKRLDAMRNSQFPSNRPVGGGTAAPAPGDNNSFLDEWLAKRQKAKPAATPAMPGSSSPSASPLPNKGAKQKPIDNDAQYTTAVKPKSAGNKFSPSDIKISGSVDLSDKPGVTTKLGAKKPTTAGQKYVTGEAANMSGGGVSVKKAVPGQSRGGPITLDDQVEIEHQLATARAHAQAQQDEKQQVEQETEQSANELSTADDGVDEIFIDVRGNLHHKGDGDDK